MPLNKINQPTLKQGNAQIAICIFLGLYEDFYCLINILFVTGERQADETNFSVSFFLPPQKEFK